MSDRDLAAELKAEREAHARTQRHLEDFMGSAADLTLKLMAATRRAEEAEAELAGIRERLAREATR